MEIFSASFISFMSHYVLLKNYSSSLSNITLGFLQGSVWGPVLFLMYIDDIYRSSNQLRFVHFSDTTTVFSSESDINNVHATVNVELAGVDNRLKANRLSLNVRKTLYTIISNQKNVFDIIIYYY